MAPTSDDPRLLALAMSVSDGTLVDWDQLPFSPDPEQMAIIEELKRVERLAVMTSTPPSTWGSFDLRGEIGQGSFGVVYRAVDPTLQREVALKILRPAAADAERHIDRALWEARSLARIDHPNVVRVYSAERIGNDVGISMELIRGQTLAAIVDKGSPYSANESLLIVRDVCRALAAVHSIDKLHGDIKAHNVMREDGGRVVLMDFGTGRDLSSGDGAAHADFAGTPAYLAPEVFAGAPRSKTTDIYSVGVLLYYLASGRYPVEGATRTEIGRHHDQGSDPVPLRDVRPDLPDAIIRIVDRALSKDPAQRFASAGSMESALTAALGMQPIPAAKVSRVTLVALFIAAAGAIGTMYAVLRPRVPAAAEASRATVVAASQHLDSATATYSIGATLVLDGRDGETRLAPGARVEPGQRLAMHIHSSVPVYVYVINEDDIGESYLLFPLPGQEHRNPLPAGQVNRLPGGVDGERVSWKVTSRGQREHFIIVASPEPSSVFERLIASIPPAVAGREVQSHRLAAGQIDLLRGVGGLSPASSGADHQFRHDPNFATPLPASDEATSGVWIRRLTLDNPAS